MYTPGSILAAKWPTRVTSVQEKYSYRTSRSTPGGVQPGEHMNDEEMVRGGCVWLGQNLTQARQEVTRNNATIIDSARESKRL